MKACFSSAKPLLALLTGLLLSGAPLQAAPAKTAADPHSAATNAVAAAATVEIPQSVFVIPASSKEGRDPFFPNSALAQQALTKPKDNPMDLSAFVLNGLTSAPRRTAMINGRTFEPGEEGEIKLPAGSRVLIKCLDIKADSAIIQVNGQRRELRLRFGL